MTTKPMKSAFGVVLVGIIVGGLLPAPASYAPAAAQTQWAVYLFDVSTTSIYRAGPAGVELVYDHAFYGPEWVIADAAVYGEESFALCWLDLTNARSGPARYYSVLVWRDQEGNRLITELYLGLATHCTVEAFSADGQYVVVSVVRDYAFADPPSGGPLWELLVVNRQGEVVQRLDEQTAAGPELHEEVGGVQVRAFNEGEIIFAALPYAEDSLSARHLPAYRWNLAAGTLEAAPAWGGRYMSVNGAEIAAVVYDEAWLHQTTLELGTPFNLVTVTGADGVPYPVYHTAEQRLGEVVFVEGGRRLAFTQTPFTSAAMPLRERAFSIVLLDRAGATTEIAVHGMATVLPAPDGFVLLTVDALPDGRRRHRLDYYGAAGQTRLWEAAGADTFGWRLIGGTESAAAALPAFVEITP